MSASLKDLKALTDEFGIDIGEAYSTMNMCDDNYEKAREMLFKKYPRAEQEEHKNIESSAIATQPNNNVIGYGNDLSTSDIKEEESQIEEEFDRYSNNKKLIKYNRYGLNSETNKYFNSKQTGHIVLSILSIYLMLTLLSCILAFVIFDGSFSFDELIESPYFYGYVIISSLLVVFGVISIVRVVKNYKKLK